MNQKKFDKLCRSIVKSVKPYELLTSYRIYSLINKSSKFCFTFFEAKQFLERIVADGPFYVYIRAKDKAVFYFYKDEQQCILQSKKIDILCEINEIKTNFEQGSFHQWISDTHSTDTSKDNKKGEVFEVLKSFGFIIFDSQTESFSWNKKAEENIPHLIMEIMNSKSKEISLECSD